MGPHMYLYGKAQEAHYQDLRREVEKSRLLAHLPRNRKSISRYAAGKLGMLLLKIGTWLKRFEQSSPVLEDHV
jgi:hypothetical protein